jgi:hypothetical protein
VQIEAIRRTPASLTADASYGKVVPEKRARFAIAFFWYRHKPISKEELFLNAGRKIQR